MTRILFSVFCFLISCYLIQARADLLAGNDSFPAQAFTPAMETRKGGIREALQLFRNPPDSTRTKVWWFHGEGPTTREGITADLEAFKAAGVGGVVYYDQVHGAGEGASDAFSPEWWEMLKFAALEAKRIGLSFEINLSNGYVAGGPWITPETGMQWLCSADTLLQGGEHLRVRLAPPTRHSWWEDVAVLAFPVNRSEVREIGLDASSRQMVDTAFVARSITYTAPKARKSRNGAMNYPNGPAETFYGMNFDPYGRVGVLECSRDGLAWNTVCELPQPGGAPGVAERTIAFEAVRAPYWRIRDAAEGLSGVTLSSRALVDRWQEKANYFSEFHDAGVTPDDPGGVLEPAAMLDLTARLQPDGTMDWNAPEGEWLVLRIAAESTRGATKHGRRNLMGLECDKMSKVAARLQFRSYVGRILDTLACIGAPVEGVCMDSHEAGPQNWTPDFPRIFRERNGYDLLPWLPVMRGWIVEGSEQSERFLRDLRRTIADAVAENYYGELDRLCQEAGVRFTAQATGNGLSLGADNIDAKRLVDKPQGEFWARDVHGSYDIVDCASAAHLYGKPIASAEAFTDAKFSDSPATLKRLADYACSRLINEFVVCASAYQPRLDEVPGNVANGRQYCLNRNNTIWPYTRPFWDYQARCAALLRQGEPVIDLLVYLGDDPPVKTLAHLLPVIPEGYNFDTTALDALEGAVVERDTAGQPVLQLRSGMTYRMLVLQRNIGQDDPVRPLLARWREAGLPVWEARGVFDEVPVPFAPDLRFHSAARLDNCVRFGHRRLPDADVYFVYNHSPESFSQEVELRTPWRRVYRLDPLDSSIAGSRNGAVRSLKAEITVTGSGNGLQRARDEAGVFVWLDLAPDESVFLVATNEEIPAFAGMTKGERLTESEWPSEGKRPAGEKGTEFRLSGTWTVQFDPAMGGPDKPVRFRKLTDWTDNPDPRVRYYSGTAVYTTSFRWHSGNGGRQFLQLDGLNWMARVTVNGHEVGTIWCAPWRLDVTDYLKPGRNELRLEVTNSLFNRMIGDAIEYPDGEGAFTHSSYPLVDADTPLVPSGLLGVRLLSWD